MNTVKTLLQEMEAYARQHRVPILSPAGRALFLEVVQRQQPLFVLEVGTAIGYSAILTATAAPDARILTIEQGEARIAVAQKNIEQAGLAHRITIVPGDASEVLPGLIGPFDFVFLDAAKGQYLDYLRKTLDKLSETAVIAADNVLFRGLVNGDETAVPRRYKTIVKRLKAYLDFVSTDPRFATTVYPDGDGMAISYYKR